MINPNSEFRDPKEARSAKSESEGGINARYSNFGFRISFGILHSTFGFYFA